MTADRRAALQNIGQERELSEEMTRRAALVEAVAQAISNAWDSEQRVFAAAEAAIDLICAEKLEEMEALRRKVMMLEMERHVFLANEEEYQNKLTWLRAETLEEAAVVFSRYENDPFAASAVADHLRRMKGDNNER